VLYTYYKPITDGTFYIELLRNCHSTYFSQYYYDEENLGKLGNKPITLIAHRSVAQTVLKKIQEADNKRMNGN
jgi:hypothetical protein